jgi:hypothetical protein
MTAKENYKHRTGLQETKHLKDSQPWTMGLAGLLRLVTWQTASVLGISKTKYRKAVVKWTVEVFKRYVEEEDLDFSEIESKAGNLVERNSAEQVQKANPEEGKMYEKPKTGLMVAPYEAQRRLRYFDEEYLNKEFDIFMALLPDQTLTQYINQFFDLPEGNGWSVFGNTNDIEQSTGIKYMVFDTLAYSHETKTLVALELKVDAPPAKDQVYKYAFLKADLESQGMIAEGSSFHLLFIGAKEGTDDLYEELVEHGKHLLDLGEEHYPKKTREPERLKSLAPLVEKVLDEIQVRHTTWQELGEYFDELLKSAPEESYAESYAKVIKGFLDSLSLKWSKVQEDHLYTRR